MWDCRITARVCTRDEYRTAFISCARTLLIFLKKWFLSFSFMPKDLICWLKQKQSRHDEIHWMPTLWGLKQLAFIMGWAGPVLVNFASQMTTKAKKTKGNTSFSEDFFTSAHKSWLITLRGLFKSNILQFNLRRHGCSMTQLDLWLSHKIIIINTLTLPSSERQSRNQPHRQFV